MEGVIITVRDYDRYAEFYAPAATCAQVINQDANPEHADDRFVLTVINKSFFSKRALECDGIDLRAGGCVPAGIRSHYSQQQ